MMEMLQLQKILDDHKLWLADKNSSKRANLLGANLQGGNLQGANLRYANLLIADLRGANLQGGNLQGANLQGANLQGGNLQGANLLGADLRYAANIPDYADAVTRIIPEGEIVVYKKLANDAIARLLVGAEVPRSNATGRKCRAQSAKVLNIWDKGGNEIQKGISKYDRTFIYTVGETVTCHEWDSDRWNECSGGIHFYLTRYEAENN